MRTRSPDNGYSPYETDLQKKRGYRSCQDGVNEEDQNDYEGIQTHHNPNRRSLDIREHPSSDTTTRQKGSKGFPRELLPRQTKRPRFFPDTKRLQREGIRRSHRPSRHSPFTGRRWINSIYERSLWLFLQGRNTPRRLQRPDSWVRLRRQTILLRGVPKCILAAVLLFGSMLVLYKVTSPDVKLGLVVLFTSLFAVRVAVLTNAKRSEIYGSTAAYAAVGRLYKWKRWRIKRRERNGKLCTMKKKGYNYVKVYMLYQRSCTHR